MAARLRLRARGARPFNHAPHIRANVDCATCHGNMAEQTVAERNVDHTMGFCVNCHNERKASNDCLTCHF